MAHHHHEEETNLDYIFYVVAALSGMFVGAIIDRGFIWVPVGGVLGLLTAVVFIKFLVKGRESA